MRQFFITVIGTIVGIFVFFVLMFIFMSMIIGAISSMGSDNSSGSSVVLTMDLRQPMLDHTNGPALFGAPLASTVHTVRALNSAKDDESVKGLFIRANQFGMTPATAEEIRLAIKDFQDSGKFVVAHSQGFEGTSLTGYLAVSAADEIWQQDTTNFSVAGMRSEVDFLGGVFEKIDAKPQIEQFHEYKSAANRYMQKGFTEPHREATTALLTSIYDVAVSHIATDRDMTEAEVEGLLKGAPHTAEAALEAGLTDRLGHYHEVLDYVKDKAGSEDTTLKSLKTYEPDTNFSSPTIAFIGAQGPVVMGKSADGSNPFSSAVTMGGDTVSDAFIAAAKDKKVKAIIFRVSSPGGSATASDQIHDAVDRAKEAGKPIIVSMGQYAASGGYYVSANADKVVAMPTTITGSIGVLGGKVALRDTFEYIGYNIEDVNIGGEFVSAYSGDEPFTQAQQAAYRQQMADIYEDFTGIVAEGRDIPIERVLEIAKGRVWTGAQAEEIGLIDEQGGLLKAIEIAKDLADIDEDSTVRLKNFPTPKTTSEQLEELFGQSAQAKADLEMMHEIAQMPEVQALLKARARLQPGQELMADIPEIK